MLFHTWYVESINSEPCSDYFHSLFSAFVSNNMRNFSPFVSIKHCRRKRIIPKSDSESDNGDTKVIANNKSVSNSNLSQISSSHSSLDKVNVPGTCIRPEVLLYATSVSFPRITINDTPDPTPQSSPEVVNFYVRSSMLV